MATISGSATNPDLNDPKFSAVYHPGGKPNFFRTVTTDAYQGPGMANYFAEVLKVQEGRGAGRYRRLWRRHGQRLRGSGGEDGHGRS